MNSYEFRNWRVSAVYTGSKKADWGDKMPENWNHHTVTVTNKINGKRTRFDFWASNMKTYLTSRYDVLSAFRCFVDDALSGEMEFEEFCREFGYDEDSRRAEKTWKACKRSTEKLRRIFDGSLYDLINSLEEYA